VLYTEDRPNKSLQRTRPRSNSAPLEPRGAHIFAVSVVGQFMDIAFYAKELDHGRDSRPS
jgi:hypothetical protein